MGVASHIPGAAGRPRRLDTGASDARLVSGLRMGDERAFELLYERYHRDLLAFCRHMLGSREEAEDALQHVFVAAYRHLRGDGRDIHLRAWLYTVARNRCLSVLRARRQDVVHDEMQDPVGDGLAAATEVERREDLRELLADLRRLPDDQRAALLLSELGALPHDEVAEVLGVRREKVKALVFQARESLAGWRAARTVDCREIREQLATLSGGALRRAPLRRHLETCDGCRAFRDEVRHQRAALAVVLPVVPGLALKAKIVGAVAAAGGAAPLTVAGTTAGLSAAASAPVAAVPAGTAAGLGGGLAAKALIAAVVLGAGGGGYAAIHAAATHHSSDRPAGAPRVAPRAPLATSPGSVVPAATPAPGTTAGHAGATGPGAGVAHGKGRGSVNGHPGGASATAPGHTKIAPASAHGGGSHGANAALGNGHANQGVGTPTRAHGAPAHVKRHAAHTPKPHPVHPATPHTTHVPARPNSDQAPKSPTDGSGSSSSTDHGQGNGNANGNGNSNGNGRGGAQPVVPVPSVNANPNSSVKTHP